MDTETLTSPAATYRARLRFRLQRKLKIEGAEHRLLVAGREVVIASLNGQTIRESEWLVMNMRGFSTADEARDFGCKLRSALEMSSVATRLGIDAGRDLATSSLSQSIKDQITVESGSLVRDNVHGLDVFEDDPRVRFINFGATGSVLVNPDRFLAFAAELHDVAAMASESSRDLVLLLNYALMRPEPVAQIIFSFSAVEMLGQGENWSRDQKLLLTELSTAAERSSIGSLSERKEVAAAIHKSMHRLSLRQGVLRLLERIHLEHLKAEWDATYAERSGLVHGLAPRAGADYSELASRVLSLCGHILLKAIATELPIADKHVDLFYQLQRTQSDSKANPR